MVLIMNEAQHFLPQFSHPLDCYPRPLKQTPRHAQGSPEEGTI
jgi:hypothetical protein